MGEASRKAARKAKPVYWIASYPRSGNTWLRAFLQALLAVVRDEDVSSPDINRLTECSTWETKATPFERVIGKPIQAMSWQEITAARPKVQAMIAASANGHFFIKTHLAFVNVLGVPTINTEATAGAIYLVRNPLDIALSLAPHMGVSLDEAIAMMAKADYHTAITTDTAFAVIGSWSQNVASWTEKTSRSVLVVRYEDMVATPLLAFARIARHIGLAATERQLEKAAALASFESLSGQEQAAGFREQTPFARDRFFRRGKTGEWRDRLTDEQVQRISAAHGNQMRRFDYLPA